MDEFVQEAEEILPTLEETAIDIINVPSSKYYILLNMFRF